MIDPNRLKLTCPQSSLSSPDLHARRRNAKAKERAARAPARARPSVARVAEVARGAEGARGATTGLVTASAGLLGGKEGGREGRR